jgi:3-deoxy-D-manno-octulosonate 8-phosphate phosphatase (KDO 8-P phosphatase)
MKTRSAGQRGKTVESKPTGLESEAQLRADFPRFWARCNQIEMLILDVDGVLTDGSIIYGDDGVELKAFHVRDGSGLKLWQSIGKQAAIITGRKSAVVDVRAAELGIVLVFQGLADKETALGQILSATGLQPGQVCAMGDDLPDLPLLISSGVAVAVADACPEVNHMAHYVTRLGGGRGAVREAVELILRCQGRWQQVVSRFQRSAGHE